MITVNRLVIQILTILVFVTLLVVIYCLFRELQLKNGTIRHIKQITTEQGDVIKVQQQNIITYKQAIAQGLVERDALKDANLKSIQAQIKAQETITNLQAIIASYEPDTMIVRDTVYMEVGFAYLRLPATWQYKDAWLSLRGTNTIDGVVFQPGGISMLNSPQITLAWRHKHESGFRNFFSRPDPVVLYHNPNPYATVTHMENVIIQEPPKWYQRRLPWLAVGVLIGVAVQ